MSSLLVVLFLCIVLIIIIFCLGVVGYLAPELGRSSSQCYKGHCQRQLWQREPPFLVAAVSMRPIWPGVISRFLAAGHARNRFCIRGCAEPRLNSKKDFLGHPRMRVLAMILCNRAIRLPSQMFCLPSHFGPKVWGQPRPTLHLVRICIRVIRLCIRAFLMLHLVRVCNREIRLYIQAFLILHN